MMKNLTHLLTAACLVLGAASFAACENDGDDGDGDGAGGSDSNGEFCQVGTEDCACGLGNQCEDPLACIEGMCIECQPGTEGCPCDELSACDEGLECTDQAPGCTLDCPPFLCLPPAADDCDSSAASCPQR